MRPYPRIIPRDLQSVIDLLLTMVQERRQDISEFENIKNVFLGGRLSGKVPTGASDVSPEDRVGDTNFDYASGYMYRVVDDGSAGIWARITMDTSW